MRTAVPEGGRFIQADGCRRLAAILASVVVLAAGVGVTWSQAPDRDVSVTMRTEKRVALVVGNGAYDSSPLRNPVNDARAMAQTLRELGFEVVALENAAQRDMRRAIIQFGDNLRGGGVGLFFFAGHGVQAGGKNFMIPVGAAIASEAEVEVESVDVASVLARMETAQNRVNIVILDACRDNPFGRSFRTTSRGLASIDAPSGTLIAYATAPGRVAADGDGPNSPYTAELLTAIRTPGLRIEDVFKRVRQALQQRTRRQQVPWEASSLVGDFVFVPPLAGGTPAPSPVAVAPPPSAPVPSVKVVPRLGSLVVRSTRETVDVWLGDRQLGQAAPGADLLVESLQAGTHVVRAKARRDGFKPWERQVPVTPDQRAEVVIDIEPLASGILRLEVGPITPEIARQLNLRSTEGVVVARVEDGSAAADAGIQRDDVIREINRQRVRSVADFERLTRSAKAGDRLTMLLQRGPMSLYVAFTVRSG